MNQIPPNDHEEPAFAGQQPSNPYARRDVGADPDLDNEVPYLRADDVQRLNRKALIFLVLIVLALAALAAWILTGGLSGEEDAPRKPRSEQVFIPAAPRDIPELPPERPTVQAPLEELPPLPVIDDARATSSSGMAGMDSLRETASLLERRMQDAAGGSQMGGVNAEGRSGGMGEEGYAAMLGGQPQQAASQGPADGPTSARPLYKPNTLLLRGTYIRCILQSRVISDFPGYTSCIVTEPVYSIDGRRLLLPRGSKVQGSYEADDLIGDRVGIVWDRITTPNGLDINMKSPGVDMLGSAGNAGHYNAHWGQRIGSALLISLLSDAFKYAAAENGPPQSAIVNGAIVQNPYESTTARTMERLANMAMDRNMTRPPTVTINQGTIVNVYVARDVDFSAVIR